LVIALNHNPRLTDRIPFMKTATPSDRSNRSTGESPWGARGMDQNTAAKPKLKIVVVEDDPTIRLFLKGALEEQLGHQVIGEAGTGTDMVRTVLDLEPDVVIFDIHLPRLNGLDALRQIYQERVIAAVAITADRDQDLVRRALEEHVLAFLVKPVEAHQLGAAVLVAWARFDELKQLTDENATLRNSLQNRKIIERAKGVLMKRNRWSEAEAFRRLQRASMNNRTTMIELAQSVLNGKEVDL
jgi:AmiR/NasT family two-component response regulator